MTPVSAGLALSFIVKDTGWCHLFDLLISINFLEVS